MTFIGSLTLYIAITGILLTRRSTRAILITVGILVCVLAGSVVLLLRSYTIEVG